MSYGLAKVDLNLPETVSQADRELVPKISYINFLFVDGQGEIQTAGFRPQGQYLRGEKYLITGKYTVQANFWTVDGQRLFVGKQEIEVTSDQVTELRPAIEKDYPARN
jgi:hypothetical protein